MDVTRALQLASEGKLGALVTIKHDGRPQLSNVLYAISDGIVRISVTDGRAKTTNLRRDPRGSLYVSQPDGWAYLVLEGEVDLTDVAEAVDDGVVDELVELYRTLQGEHPDWDDYRRSMVADRRLVLRFRPTHAYGMWPEA